MALADILAGFAQGFQGSRQRALERAEREDLKKLQVKALKRQLDEQDTQEENKRKLFELIGGGQPVPGNRPSMDDEGFAMPAATTAPKSLTDILADPQGQMALLQSGLMKPADILKAGKPEPDIAAQLEAIRKVAPGLEIQDVIVQDGKVVPKLGQSAYSQALAKERAKLSVVEESETAKMRGRGELTDEAKRNRDISVALQTYDKAREGLIKGLEGATTGPLIGKLPAITSNQQVAKGAVSAMAPVLKQLFRAAGEGVFTDRDQQLLIDMIPSRETSPEARMSMIENIDAIVRAKLGMPAVSQVEKPSLKGPSKKDTKVIDFNSLPKR